MIKSRTANANKPSAGLKEIIDLLAGARDTEAMYDIVHALLTPAERHKVSQRWQIVKMLAQGVSQRVICARLRVSLCNTTRGSWELKHGRTGFRSLVERVVGREKRRGTKKGAKQ